MAKKRFRQAARHERRFFPQSSANPILVRLIGAVGAMSLGAGAFGQFASDAPEPSKVTPWLLAGGAALFGFAIWWGTSGDPVLRVGAGGAGIDRGTIRRIPWHATSKVSWDGANKAVVVQGRDEADQELIIRARVASQPQAAAWIVKEARERVPHTVEVPEDADIPAAVDDPTDVLPMDPLQVVGRRCAESNKSIAYEPDARVCTRCERVYHKDFVPKTCECGAALGHLREKSA
ncbi:hypothetical protein [Pendulispora albinea]|uniref:Uncharacterized protein n=1 Tax=Pendulispora albinea TaxID=2741071 RepID=A0ABZ2M0L2_9BACT